MFLSALVIHTHSIPELPISLYPSKPKSFESLIIPHEPQPTPTSLPDPAQAKEDNTTIKPQIQRQQYARVTQPNQPVRPRQTMAPPKELNFITGNKNKLAEVQAILSETPVDLRSQAVDLVEIQGTIEEISTDKAKRAAEAVCCFSPLIYFTLLYLFGEQITYVPIFWPAVVFSLLQMENVSRKWKKLTADECMRNRSRDRFWLRIRACALMHSTSYLVLMCTCAMLSIFNSQAFSFWLNISTNSWFL